MAKIKEKKFIRDNPKLMAEWCWEKNADIDPTKLTTGTHKKVWWQCSNGHCWEAIVSNRARLGRNCPYCTKQKLLIGENDLCTTHPELAEEWNYEKNGINKPEQFMGGSHKKAWWICKKGHEWEAEIKSRSQGVGCPYCNGKRVSINENDFASKYPVWAKEWHPTKNKNLKPTDVSYGSGKKVWWKCKNDHEWQASIDSRSRGVGCPICSSWRRTSFPEQAIYYYVKKTFPDAINTYKDIFNNASMELDIFIPSIKVGIEYDGKRYHTNFINEARDLKKYAICKDHGIKLIRITDIKKVETTINCDHKIVVPQINNKNLSVAISQLLQKLNTSISVDVAKDRLDILKYLSTTDISLQTEFPDLAKEWNYNKNERLLPSMFLPRSNEKVWWQCAVCSNEWKTAISERTGHDKTGCPKCAREYRTKKRIEANVLNKGSIVKTHPHLLEEWDYDKNIERPEYITAGSGKNVWWKCAKCGYSWKTSVGHRTSRNSSCPCCSNKVIVKGKNDLATTNPGLLDEWNNEKNIFSPEEIGAGTSKKAWWKCSVCGNEWCARINVRVKGCGCPECAIKNRSKKNNSKSNCSTNL